MSNIVSEDNKEEKPKRKANYLKGLLYPVIFGIITDLILILLAFGGPYTAIVGLIIISIVVCAELGRASNKYLLSILSTFIYGIIMVVGLLIFFLNTSMASSDPSSAITMILVIFSVIYIFVSIPCGLIGVKIGGGKGGPALGGLTGQLTGAVAGMGADVVTSKLSEAGVSDQLTSIAGKMTESAIQHGMNVMTSGEDLKSGAKRAVKGFVADSAGIITEESLSNLSEAQLKQIQDSCS
ncbi:MAG: hypothetical protein EAX96_13635 [Candidatus Lokiarchaeota archaeon]|nr:hypothetical protein [Candidatus Lokiarchaeota archaeon]